MPNTSLFLPPTVSGYRDSRGVHNFRGQFENKIVIGSLSDNVLADISSKVTNVDISYSISEASALSFDVIDVDLTMSKNNYFILGRDVVYTTHTLGKVNSYSGEVRQIQQLFEIANVTISQGPGGSAVYAVKCYSKAIQQMKRDKKPGAIKGNGSQYIKNAAKKYGLEVYCQQTSKAKQITKSSGSKQKESLWDVMRRLADDAKFVLFEVDGVLVFASEKFLLYKWGTDIKYTNKKVSNPKTKKKKIQRLAQRFIPLQWPNSGDEYVGTAGYFRLVERPTITKSANDPYAADGSCLVERFNGTQVRPGMTAYVGRVPNMSGFYLVESVSFKEMVPEPVTISFRTLTRDEEKDVIKQLPIGKTYQQTSVSGQNIRTVAASAKTEKGRSVSKARPDKRITGANLPNEENRYRYPQMEYANISKTYAAIIGSIPKSTNDRNSIVLTGNIDLWERPVFLLRNPSDTETLGYQTLFDIEEIFESMYVAAAGSEYHATLLPTIYTENGEAVQKTAAEAISRYANDIEDYGTAKFLATLSGSTKENAKRNARDYAILLYFQQQKVMENRFPDFTLSTLENNPGSEDSEW